MDQLELNRERRKQRALERLGTNNPRCPFCGFDNPLALELHHIAGEAFDEKTASRLSQLPSRAERLAEGSSRLHQRSTQRSGARRTRVARLSRHVRALGQMAPRTRNKAIRRR